MRRSYDKHFKIVAIKLVLEDAMSVAEAATALSIHYNSLYSWISECEEYSSGVSIYRQEIPNTVKET
ncbi:transposase [Clostridium saccharobutylicum]|uniref:Transposase n=1 Tax=Clostridium saccharobutylicum TaxID=169679 RepID=A0A1S8NBT9_CLOSA|nr:transposase [Clostridium saccharobutylicum]OOM13900.1 transposase [Clostridium saccharobutylicum]